MVLRKNPSLADSDHIGAGEEVIIPNDYSPRMILYVDKENYTPVIIEVYDDEGLYEHYEFDQVKIDPQFKENEFEPSFEEYDF